MSYSVEDFFQDELAEKFAKLFENFLDPERPATEDLYEKFMDIMQSAFQGPHRGEDFARRLVALAINPDQEDLGPDQLVKKFFYMIYEDKELRKLEYSHDYGTVVQTNYCGEKEKEELQDKIAVRIASVKSGHF
jgi:hypothetical protein